MTGNESSGRVNHLSQIDLTTKVGLDQLVAKLAFHEGVRCDLPNVTTLPLSFLITNGELKESTHERN